MGACSGSGVDPRRTKRKSGVGFPDVRTVEAKGRRRRPCARGAGIGIKSSCAVDTGASNGFVRVLKYGAASRSPALRAERRRLNAEGRRAKCEVQSAKCEVRVVRMARAVSDRTLAGRRMHGWAGSTQRRQDGRRHPQRISFAAWRTWRLCVRSGRRDLTPGGGTPSGGRRPLGNTPPGFEFRGRVAQIALTRFPPSLARPVLPSSGPGAGRLTSFGF